MTTGIVTHDGHHQGQIITAYNSFLSQCDGSATIESVLKKWAKFAKQRI